MPMTVCLLALLSAGNIQVEGDASCPSAGSVETILTERTLPERVEVPRRARLRQLTSRSVELSLSGSKGDHLASKELSATTCEALASAVAATLLAWDATIPEVVSTTPPPRPRLRRPLHSRPSPSAAVSTLVWRGEVAVAGVLATGLAHGGATVSLRATRPQSSWWVGLAAKVMLPVSVALGRGHISWTRPSLGAGGAWRLLEGPYQLDLRLMLEAGLLTAWGRGFTENRSAQVFDPGVSSGLQLARSLGSRLGAFAELGATFFLREQVAEVGGVGIGVVLPRAVVSLGIGLSWEG